MRRLAALFLCLTGATAHAQGPPPSATPAPAVAATPSPGLAAAGISAAMGEAEAQRCEEKIQSARRDTLARYETALADLQIGLQKAADLEGALAVRAERQRAAQSGELNEANFVAEPKALRAIQVQLAQRAQDIVAQLVQESIPRLLELKKQLTVAGRLDEAVTVRDAIERLQNKHLAVIHPDPNLAVPVEALLRTYAADRARGDAVYQGQKVLVRGTIAGYRPDPADPKRYLIYLASGTSNAGWIQCAFSTNEYRFRDEKQFNAQFLLMSPKSGDATPLRLVRGSAIDVLGTCTGWDETVRLDRCELAK
jgi:hypothetical protein